MINKHSYLQRFLFANSTKSIIRQRNRPRIYDHSFVSLWFLRRALKKVIATSETGIHSVVDIGCGDMPYKIYFPESVRYVGIDFYSTHPDVKKIDVEKPFQEEPADMVICSEVLEHSFNFQQVVENVNHAMKHGGVGFITVPYAYEVHGWDYHDFFRYSPDALKKILSSFSEVSIEPTTSYLPTLFQKWNNLVYYVPLPYIVKVPFFVANNILVLLIELLVRGALRLLSVKEESFLQKLIYSYPINFICIVKKQ